MVISIMKQIFAVMATLGLMIVVLAGCTDENAKFKPKDGEEPNIPVKADESRADKPAEQFLPPPPEGGR